MSVDTSIAPYYDDFNVEKNFHRILFKPGVAVQARELTQSQTILQEQIKRVGDYLFTNGDKVSGSKPIINYLARTIRLKEINSLGETVDVTKFLNMFVTAPESDVIGQVEFVFRKDDPDIGDPPTIVMNLKRHNTENDGMFSQNTELYFYNNYTNAINKASPIFRATTAQDIVKQGFAIASPFSRTIALRSPNENVEVGDYLDHPLLTKKLYIVEKFSSTEFEINEPPGVSISTLSEGGDRIQFTKRATSPTVIVTQDTSVYYKDGFFIRSALQKIVPDKNTAFPTKVVGFYSQENLITNNDDNSLLDPALGSSNYFAEGADRLQIQLDLVSLNLRDVITENAAAGTSAELLFEDRYVNKVIENAEDFIPLIRFNKGKVEYVKDVTINGQVGDVLAERTFDESGNYVVDRFTVTPIDSVIDPNTLYFSVSPGKAYIGGRQVKTVGPTEVTTTKNNTNVTIQSYNVNTSQGNYVRVTNLAAGLTAHDEILSADTYVELHSVTNPTSIATRIGVIQIKSLEYDSFIGDRTIFKLFYHTYEPAAEAPPSWDAWSRKYNIPVDEGRQLSELLYESNATILTEDQVNGPIVQFVIVKEYYGLYREPDAEGLAFWHGVWKNKYNKQITQEFIWEFVNAALQDPTDKDRVITDSKTFLSTSNNSPFIGGLIDVGKIRSIVGVRNEYTQHGTSSTYSGPFFYAEIDSSGLDSSGDIIIFDVKPSDNLVFDTNKRYVKDITNIKTEYRRVVKNAAFSNGVFTKTLTSPESFSLGDGIVPSALARTQYIVLVKSGQTASVPYGVQPFNNATITLTNNSQTLIIDLGDNSFNGIADISFRVQNDVLTPRSKTLVEDAYKVLNITTADLPYSVGKSDIYGYTGIYRINDPSKIRGVYSNTLTYNYGDVVVKNGVVYESIQFGSNLPLYYANSWTSLTPIDSANYVKDNGQRDSIYDHGYVKYVGPTSGIPGNVVVTFGYFTHTGEGPCTVTSYDPSLYGFLPTYRSTVNAREYNLRDCIDFRPRRKDDTVYKDFEPAVFPLSFTNTEIDITYYLGRIDRLYAVTDLQNFDSPYKKFYIEQGVPSENPALSQDATDASRMCIATIQIPPYTLTSSGVNIVYEENRRYTMRDIGAIDKLVKNLDKTVKIHSMQLEVLQATIMNEDTDEILVKSGVLIEDFSDLGKADIINNQFSCIIMKENKECFPAFNCFNMDLRVIEQGAEEQNQNFFMFNDIITLPFEEDLFIAQSEANSTLVVNPGSIDDSRGRVRLSKRNSFAVNLLISGGTLIAFKSLAEYALANGFFQNATGVAATPGAFSQFATDGALYKYIQDALNQDGVLGALARAGQSLYDFIPSAQSIMSGMQKFEFSFDTPRELWASFSNNYIDPVTGAIESFFSPIVDIFKPDGTWATPGQLLTNAGDWLLSSETWWDITDDFFLDLAGENLSYAFNYLLEGDFVSSIGSVSDAFTAFKNTSLGKALPYIPALTRLAEGDVARAGVSATLTYLALSNPVTAPFAPFVDLTMTVVEELWNSGTAGKAAVIGGGAALIWFFFSDKRSKENIEFVRKDENGLNLYRFKYKEEFKPYAGYGTYVGYIAQEVLELFPKAVSIAKFNGEEYYTLNYSLIGK